MRLPLLHRPRREKLRGHGPGCIACDLSPNDFDNASLGHVENAELSETQSDPQPHRIEILVMQPHDLGASTVGIRAAGPGRPFETSLGMTAGVSAGRNAKAQAFVRKPKRELAPPPTPPTTKPGLIRGERG